MDFFFKFVKRTNNIHIRDKFYPTILSAMKKENDEIVVFFSGILCYGYKWLHSEGGIIIEPLD